jgi:hypothetical protein
MPRIMPARLNGWKVSDAQFACVIDDQRIASDEGELGIQPSGLPLDQHQVKLALEDSLSGIVGEG